SPQSLRVIINTFIGLTEERLVQIQFFFYPKHFFHDTFAWLSLDSSSFAIIHRDMSNNIEYVPNAQRTNKLHMFTQCHLHLLALTNIVDLFDERTLSWRRPIWLPEGHSPRTQIWRFPRVIDILMLSNKRIVFSHIFIFLLRAWALIAVFNIPFSNSDFWMILMIWNTTLMKG
ncbi:hypothetical protein ACJX0J_037930, partial [Zea mays]